MHVTLRYCNDVSHSVRKLTRMADIRALLRQAGDIIGAGERSRMTVYMATDNELRDLNERFMGISEPTDVLAFPYDGAYGYIGELAISVERAMSQSNDLAGELRLLAIHGFLHCVGYDHETLDDANTMTAMTRILLPQQIIPDLEVPH